MSKSKKNKQLVERIQIEKTPFTAVKMMDSNWILTMGQWRLSEKLFNNFDEILTHIEESKWELLAIFTTIVAEQAIKKLKENE